MQVVCEKWLMKPVLCNAYFKLCGDIFRLQFDGCFLDNFKIPGAKDFHRQDTLRFINPETLSK